MVWRDADELPTPPNASKEAPGYESYRTALAGQKVSEALATMNDAFAFVGSLLDPPTAAREPPIVESR